MITQNILHYFRRIYEIGPYFCLILIYHRFKKWWFVQYANKKKYTWQRLQRKHKLQSCKEFLAEKRSNTCWQKIQSDSMFINHLPTEYKEKSKIYAAADACTKMHYTILGYKTFICSPNTIPWHSDFFCKNKSPKSWINDFYRTIKIPNTTITAVPDIKIPWELSRLHNIFILGLGYAHAQNHTDKKRIHSYAQAFMTIASSWMDNNKFLHGVNWINPMEVAIRSINLIWGFEYFKHATIISEKWWERYTIMLDNHLIYLENHTEISDRPNNHLIADQLGLFYLQTFFNAKETVLPQLLKTIAHQILPDGTSYEGSTAYHRLVTEMVMHALLLCKHVYNNTPESLITLYKKLHTFIDDCTDESGNFIFIGDNDSGAVVTFKPILANESNNFVKTYQNFGLTIIKKSGWHITFRHPTYQSFQPTGHFHQDWLAITLSIDGIPIFIDPGSYVYSSNQDERNAFRSIKKHNTFWTDYQFKLDQLFVLPKKKHHSNSASIIIDTETISIQDYHLEYNTLALTAQRKILFNHKKQQCTITDWWNTSKENFIKTNAMRKTYSSLHCAPNIVCENKKNKTVAIMYKNKQIASLSSSFLMNITADTVSPWYGRKIETYTLTTETILTPNTPHESIITRI